MEWHQQQKHPFERIEVREDGYLWLVNYQAQQPPPPETTDNDDQRHNHQQPLVLHSTSLLLQQLREKRLFGSLEKESSQEEDQDENEELSISNKDDDDDESNEEEKDASEDDDEQVEEASENNDDEESVDEHDKKDDNDPQKKKQDKPEHENEIIINKSTTNNKNNKNAKDDLPQEQRYKELKRETNLSDRILVALAHIPLFRHDTRKKKAKNGGDNRKGDRRETKVKALEHQRERLYQQQQQQQQKQKQEQTAVTAANDDDENDDSHQSPNEENADDDDESVSANEHQLLHQNPYVRVVRTLNSVRALLPVIRQLLSNNDRERKDLRMGRKGTRLPNKTKKPCCWLIGNHVFDVVTVRHYQSIQRQLQELLECFLPHDIAVDISDGVLEDELRFWQEEWLSYVWVPPQNTTNTHSISLASPFAILKEFQDQKSDDDDDVTTSNHSIEDTCRKADQKFFAEERSKKDAKKAAVEQEKYNHAVNRLHSRISHLLTKDFSGARLSVYGSCLSDLSLKASDVDLSLYLPQAELIKKNFEDGTWSPSRYEKEMTKLVREVWRKLMYRKSEFADMVPVTRARVPVVKGCYLKANNPFTADGSLHFDICFLNDIAVANSSLLREYSLMDESVRELMIVVKKWAKDNDICSAQDNTLSSYAWMNLVIFYLQCIQYVPNLQCPKLMQQFGLTRQPNEYWHNVNNLDTCYLTLDQALQVWKRSEHLGASPISATALLYGFFHFYANEFMGSVSMVSIKRGREDILPKTVFRRCSPFFCIEDPFETFDSHCPHDLGIPVNEVQIWRIFECLKCAEQHLRQGLLGSNDMTSLWPSKEHMEKVSAEKAKGRSQGDNGSGSKRKRGKRKQGGKQQQQQHVKGGGGKNNKGKTPQNLKAQQETAKAKQDQSNEQQQLKAMKGGDKEEKSQQQPNGSKSAHKRHQHKGRGGAQKQQQKNNGNDSAPQTGRPKKNTPQSQEAATQSAADNAKPKKKPTNPRTPNKDSGNNKQQSGGVKDGNDIKKDQNKNKSKGGYWKNRRGGKKKQQEGGKKQTQTTSTKN